MADTNPTNPSASDGEDMRDILATFEQILEIMPDDRGALEAASQAALQCGEMEKACTYRLHLADLLEAAGETSELEGLTEAIRLDADPRAQEWIQAYDLRTGHATAAAAEASARDDVQITHQPAESNISEEIDIAWKLYDEGQISQEDYSTLVRELTETPHTNKDEIVSVLHALEATNHRNLDEILSFMSRTSRLPYLSLSAFTMRPELVPLLPSDFIQARGALVFDMLSDDLLVAVLNPFSESLRREVQARTGKSCHFYLVRAAEFDLAFRKLKESQE